MEVKETRDARYEENEEGERRLNQYVLKEVLGRGSFGIVSLAEDVNTGTQYAVKEFSKTRLRKNALSKMSFGFRGRGRGRGGAARPPLQAEDPFEHIKSEIAVMKKLNHPNIVKLYEVLDAPEYDSLYMVFELCGPAVMDVGLDSEGQGLGEDKAREIMRQALLGLEYLHEHDIAHRDIKPDNLLTSPSGTFKIVDFGVSEMFSKGNDRSKKSAGSPAFFSPEMCTAQHGELSTKACDVWALGVTLFCLVFGHLPFRGDSILELYENIREQPLSIPESASSELRDLLSKMLDKNPESRIDVVGIKNHPWMTRNDTQPMASTAENVEEIGKPVTEVTEEDLRTAIKPLGLAAAATVLRAAARWKRLGSRGSFSSMSQGTGGSSPGPEGKETLVEGMAKLATVDSDRFKDAEGDPEVSGV